MALTYRDAGVDIKRAIASSTASSPSQHARRSPSCIASIGGFAGLCAIPRGMREPILVSGTDGVGTKLKLAFAADRHDTVGIDLVAMCVNDVVTSGARPLFFLDYFATGKLDVEQRDTRDARASPRAASRRAARCSAARPRSCPASTGRASTTSPASRSAWREERAPFAARRSPRATSCSASRPRACTRTATRSRARCCSSARALPLEASMPELGEPLVDALLRPTRIYAAALQAALGRRHQALCHVTGGGLPDNLPRVLPNGVGAELDERSWKRRPSSSSSRARRASSDAEMCRTFNMGSAWSRSSCPRATPKRAATRSRTPASAARGRRASRRTRRRCAPAGPSDS